MLRFSEAHVASFLARLSCPVLLVRPDNGMACLAGSALASRMNEVRDLRTLDVEGGHHVHLTHPGRIAGPIKAFLRG
jgi:pimeloyl-ACP methyl ester carboxylesterase